MVTVCDDGTKIGMVFGDEVNDDVENNENNENYLHQKRFLLYMIFCSNLPRRV